MRWKKGKNLRPKAKPKMFPINIAIFLISQVVLKREAQHPQHSRLGYFFSLPEHRV